MSDEPLILFTDASCSLDGSTAGTGFLARHGDKVVLGARPLTGIASKSYHAEAVGLCTAVLQCLEEFPSAKRIVAMLDSQSTVRMAKGWDPVKGRMGDAIMTMRSALRRASVEIEPRWTRGHGDEGTVHGFANAIVDRLAKAGRIEDKRFLRRVRYTDEGWARAVADSCHELRNQPYYVGRATACDWLGFGPHVVENLIATGRIEATEDGSLLKAYSIRQLRREMEDSGVPMRRAKPWSPGPLVEPPSAPTALCSVGIVRREGGCAVGVATLLGDRMSLESMPLPDRPGRRAVEMEGILYALTRLSSRIPQMTEVLLHVEDRSVRDLLERREAPEDKPTRLAVGRVHFAMSRVGAKLAVKPAPCTERDGTKATSLWRIASYLSWIGSSGRAVEAEAPVTAGWEDDPDFYAALGMDAATAHVDALEDGLAPFRS